MHLSRIIGPSRNARAGKTFRHPAHLAGDLEEEEAAGRPVMHASQLVTGGRISTQQAGTTALIRRRRRWRLG
jgi:hypothetical protein